MAETAITVQEITAAGITETLTDCNADGQYYTPDGQKTFIRVTNTNAAERTVTVHQQVACELGDADLHDIPKIIPATTGDLSFTVPSTYYYTHPTDGKVHITYSAVLGLKIGVFKLP